MFQYIKLFIPEKNIIYLNNNHTYKFKNLILYRIHHFNYCTIFPNFKKINNCLFFDDMTNIKFLCDPTLFLKKTYDIYNEHKNNYKLYDNIMMVKTTNDKLVFSTNRCMESINDNTLEILNNNNIKILSIDDFKDIYEYICVFYHAKNVIVSYGGIACTNRFFCNPNANVILIANLHYRHEYEYNNENQKYWHVNHSHIFPVKSQTVLLDFDNFINENNVNKIIELLK